MQNSDYLRQLWNYVAADICEVLPYMKQGLIIFGVALISFLLLIWVLMPGRMRMRSAVWISMLAGYSGIVLYITFLSREPGSREGLDLLPFSTIGSSVRGDAWTVENILLFIPYGLMIPGIFANLSTRGHISIRLRKILPAAAIGLLLSTAIEASQYLTKRGHVQVDDLITNVSGTLIGILLYRIITAVWHAVTSGKQIK